MMACDSSENASALAQADRRFVVPPVHEPSYFDVLLSICRAHRVRLLLSVNDLELIRLAHEAPRFQAIGTIPVIASPQAVVTCLDKWATFQFLRSANIPTPDTFLSPAAARRALARGDIRFPLVIKPRWGSASVGIEHVENDRELELAYGWGQIQARRGRQMAEMVRDSPDGRLVIQEWLAGQEYGMDVVNDLRGRYVCTLGRRKLWMRAGETDRAVSVSEPQLERLGEEVGQQLGHVGNLDCDVVATDRAWLVLDLNPRFGGGYPFSHLAGANLPAALIAWANEDEPNPAWLRARPGVVGSKGICMVTREYGPVSTARDLENDGIVSS